VVCGAFAEAGRAVGEVCVVGRSYGMAVVGGMVVHGASVEVDRAPIGEVPMGKVCVGCSDMAAVVGGTVVRGESAEVVAAVVVLVIREVGVVIRNDGHDGMIGRAVQEMMMCSVCSGSVFGVVDVENKVLNEGVP